MPNGEFARYSPQHPRESLAVRSPENFAAEILQRFRLRVREMANRENFPQELPASTMHNCHLFLWLVLRYPARIPCTPVELSTVRPLTRRMADPGSWVGK